MRQFGARWWDRMPSVGNLGGQQHETTAVIAHIPSRRRSSEDAKQPNCRTFLSDQDGKSEREVLRAPV